MLFVQPFLWPVHYRGNSWVHIWTHVQPLSLLRRYRFSHQRGEQYRGGQTRVWTPIVSSPRLNEVWKGSGGKALWLTATGTQARSMPTGPQKLQSDPRHVNSQKDMYICVGKTTWYWILQRRAANFLMHRSEKPELNWNLWLDWTGQRGLLTWLSSTVPNLSFMRAQLSCAQENCRVATAVSATFRPAKMSWTQRLGCRIKGALCKNCNLMNLYSKQTGRITRVNSNSCYLWLPQAS